MRSYAEVVAALEARGSRQRGELWSCPCFVHARGDRNPSLHVTEGADGAAELHCYAGGSVREVLAALGLEPSSAPIDHVGYPIRVEDDAPATPFTNMFADARARLQDGQQAAQLRAMLEQIGCAPGARLDELIGAGIIAGPCATPGSFLIAVEHHADDAVELVGMIERDTTGTARIKSRSLRGSRRDFVPAPEALPARRGPVLVLEGERDALVAYTLGVDAVSIPGAAAKSTPARVKRLAALNRPLVLAPDADAAGRQLVVEWYPALIDAGVDVRVVDLWPGRSDGADLADYVLEHAIVDGALEHAIAAAPDLPLAELLPYLAFTDPVDIDRVLLESGLAAAPWSALPAAVRVFGEGLRDVEGLPESFAFTAALAPFAMLGTYLRVFTTGDRLGTPCTVYVLLVGGSGSGKSRAVDRVLRLITPELDTWFEQHAPRFLRSRNERVALEEDRKRLRRGDFANGDDFAAALTAIDLQLRDHDDEAARRPMSTTGSPTVEALVRTMQSGAVLWANPEATEPLRMMLDENGSRLGVPASAWSGERLDEDRMSSDRRIVTLAQLSILWAIQTSVLGDALRRNPELQTQGMLPRMLVVPSGGTLVGWRSVSHRQVDETIEDAMRDAVGAAFAALHPLDLSRYMRLRLDDAAEERLITHLEEIEVELRPGGAYSDDLEAALRIGEQLRRFAGVLHLAAGHDHGTAISADTIDAAHAVAIWQYQLRSQLGGTVQHRRHLRLVIALARWDARRSSSKPFAVRDALEARSVRALNATAAEVRRSLRLLEQAGVAIASDDSDSATFALHPDLAVALDGQNPQATTKENQHA